jgi:plasmid stabilization system protein ParE
VKVVFSARAEDQLRDIQAAFRDVSPEVAARFAAEVRNAVWRLGRFPLSGQAVPKARRVVLQRSRYLMVYEISDGQVYVTKFVHQRQRPDS